MSALNPPASDPGALKKAPAPPHLVTKRALQQARSGSRYSDSTLQARLVRVAVPAGADLDLRLAAEELALAALIHSHLMDIPLPSVSFANLESKTVPCSAIGGDFSDAVAGEDSLCAVVADVSGKGVPAAIVAAMLQGIIHAQMLARKPLAEIAATVNRFLCSRAPGKYAAMVLVKVQMDGTAEYLNCGHGAPVVVKSNGVRRLDGRNAVVGLLSGAQYRAERCQLHPGDRLLIFTDGIMEAEDSSGRQFSETQFDLLVHLPTTKQILDHVSNFADRRQQRDDWTVFQLRFDGGAQLPLHCACAPR